MFGLTTLIFIFSFLSAPCLSETEILHSPEGSLELVFELRDFPGMEDCPVYGISWKGKEVLAESRLGFNLQKGDSLVDRFEVTETRISHRDAAGKSLVGEKSPNPLSYNELLVQLVHLSYPVYTMNLRFRCYDHGVAFRYEFPGKAARDQIDIADELTCFRFKADHEIWSGDNPRGKDPKMNISDIRYWIEEPLTLVIDDHLYATIADTGQGDYTGMSLVRSLKDSHTLVSRLDGQVTAEVPMETPWRVVMLTGFPGEIQVRELALP